MIVGDATKGTAKDPGYVKYNVGGDLNVSLIDDVLTAGVSGSYYNKNYKNIATVSKLDTLKTAYKGYAVNADLAWTIMPGTTLTGNVGMEKRAYQYDLTVDEEALKKSVTDRRSGMYRVAGITLDQQLLESTKLSVSYKIKDYAYDKITGDKAEVKFSDYWTRGIALNLKMTF